jgi:phosphoribosylformimino-5-aminoimidazole carboxamide ribotide isomerase
MRIIPVLDLQGGQVVHAVAGERSQYRPVRSVLATDASPTNVARGLVEHFGFREVYIADLDAITGKGDNQAALGRIASAGLRLLVDAGVGTPEQAGLWLARDALESSLAGLIVGLESVACVESLAACRQSIGSELAAFSLDMKHGRPLTPVAAWRDLDAVQLADLAVQAGFARLILLDLARVGGQRGTGLEALCRRLRDRHPQLELIVGGGVRGVEDLRALEAVGCDAVLLATALHTGSLTREALAGFVRYSG